MIKTVRHYKNYWCTNESNCSQCRLLGGGEADSGIHQVAYLELAVVTLELEERKECE